MATQVDTNVIDEASKNIENLLITANKQAFDTWELFVRSGQQVAESGVKAWFKTASDLFPKQ